MSSMFIECTSRDSNHRNESASGNAGRSMEGTSSTENMANELRTGGTIPFQVTASKRQEEIARGGGTGTSVTVTDTSDVEASTSTAVSCRSVSPSRAFDRRLPLVSKAGNSVSRSSCKRKPALPKKRPSTMQEPVIISAETGEAVDDDIISTQDSVCSAGNTVINRDCKIGLVNNSMKGKAVGSVDFCKGATDLQRLLSTTEGCIPPNLYGATNTTNIFHCDSELLNGQSKMEHWETSSISSVSDALVIDTRSNSLSSLENANGKQRDVESPIVAEMNESMDSARRSMSSSRTPSGTRNMQIFENLASQANGSVDRINKHQSMTDMKNFKLSDQFVDQRNGSGISNLNDVLILNAAVNSFLWANAAAGTDGANAFITPEMLASLSAAGLSSSLGVPCASTLTDKPYDSVLLKTASLPRISATTPELFINDAPSPAASSTNSLHLKASFEFVEPIASELIPEPAEFVDVRETPSPQYETLKPLIPPPSASANEAMLPACGTLLLNHSAELITKTSQCCTNDDLLNVDQQQNANMLLLEAAAAATAAGTIRDLLGITSANGGDIIGADIMNSHKQKSSAIPSTSATAEIVVTSTPNIFFNDDDDGIVKKHDRCLGDRSTHNGKTTPAVENLGDSKRQSNKAVRCKISDVKLNVKRRANEEVPLSYLSQTDYLALEFNASGSYFHNKTLSSAARAITKEEKIDLDELENFAQTFKKQRIKFGFTQGDVGLALGRRYGTDFSQTTISRFEALNLSFKNMCKLRPLLKEWLEDAEAALANGATISDLLDAPSKEPTPQYPTSVIHLPLNNNKSSSMMSVNVSSGNKMPSDESPSPNGSIVCSSGAGVPLKKRRKRTNLDLAQRSALDAYFDMNPRPDHDRMAEIAELVGLDRDVVRVWFCNRRQKLRKE
uniref:POU domain protein n=2 Tax=Filarioidea TaxID=6295 RepID=A0A915PDX4_9BILA